MEDSIIGTLILIVTGLVTYKGFKDRVYFDRYAFDVDGILLDRQFDRLLTSGFLHADWLHFGFNMAALLSFSYSLEIGFGPLKLLGLYFFSLIAGSLLALYVHRNHGDYRAIGASGAVSGVILAYIVLYPDATMLSQIFRPNGIPVWVVGAIYMIISIFGIKYQKDNIGHEAHLGGAIAGVLLVAALNPVVALDHWWVVLLLVVPTLIFLILIIRNPRVLMIDNYWGEEVHRLKNTRLTGKRQLSRREKSEELDRLLDKIATQGFDSLSRKEKRRLEELKDDLR